MTQDTITAIDYLENLTDLEKEAADVLPWSFEECTYSKGQIRQPVYACRTCQPVDGIGPGGVCYSCSIACHSGFHSFFAFIFIFYFIECMLIHNLLKNMLQKC